MGASLIVHEPKTLVDLSKAMDNHTFRFDGVFGAAATNAQIFEAALRPMVAHLFGTKGGHATCFAYGQTGSGKTVTMEGLRAASGCAPGNAAGLYALVAEQIFDEISRSKEGLVLRAGFFEIYRGKCYDLLTTKKKRIEVMEDEKGHQQMVGLQLAELATADALLALLGRADRTTRATAQNEVSSRSHAILQLSVVAPAAQSHQAPELRCKLSMVDLAGSEWAAKAQSDHRDNRLDGAEINKSLLCLKECIRALGTPGAHVPFRGSKLTQVLKDSFVGKTSRTLMIANIAPTSNCCEHSLNTLRYAQRVKDWQAQERSQQKETSPPMAAAPAKAAAAPKPKAAKAAPFEVPTAKSAPATARAPPLPGTGAGAAAFAPPAKAKAAAAAEEEEDLDLSQSLKFSSEQLAAHKAARHLFDAEEQMYGAHAASCARAAEALPAERAMADGAARGEGDADAYAAQLRETIAWKQRELDALMKAVGSYEAAAKAEDAARKNVRGVVTVGQG